VTRRAPLGAREDYALAVALLAVLAASDTGAAPEGALYIAAQVLGHDLSDLERALAGLEETGAIEWSGHVATITERGRRMAVVADGGS